MPDAEEDKLVKWLAPRARARIRRTRRSSPSRGPRAKSTNAIITEYELPRLEIATHDVSGDGKGNIWYSTHRNAWFGTLDPQTGKVNESSSTAPPSGALTRARIGFMSDPNGIVWASENWAHNIIRLDPKTGKITRRSPGRPRPS